MDGLVILQSVVAVVFIGMAWVSGGWSYTVTSLGERVLFGLLSLGVGFMALFAAVSALNPDVATLRWALGSQAEDLYWAVDWTFKDRPAGVVIYPMGQLALLALPCVAGWYTGRWATKNTKAAVPGVTAVVTDEDDEPWPDEEPPEQKLLSDEFRAGARAMYGALLHKAVRHAKENPGSAPLPTWVSDALTEVSLEDWTEWSTIDEAYDQGFQAGVRANLPRVS